MKSLLTIFIFISCLSFISCKSEKAKRYSDQIVAKEKNVEDDIVQATKKLQVFFISDSVDSIVAVSAQMEKELDAIIADISKTKAPKLKEAENFKNETLKYLQYRKDIFSTYKDYGMQTTPQGREMVRMSMMAFQNQEKIMHYNLEAAQVNFARANHVKVKQ